ncbi:MAG: transporter substrate-binding domain-containing protein, partial [Desulfobacteraceae bacterium]|nr:transporter substrate-binding domain-containing protein [Desulfobacteraceae bacterium]
MRHIIFFLIINIISVYPIAEAAETSEPGNAKHILVRLTSAEESWLKTHQMVRVAVPTEFPPLMFAKDSDFQGIIPDYLNLFSQRTGIRFELVSVPLCNMLGQIEDRQTDMFPAYMNLNPNLFMNLTDPCFSLSWVLVNRVGEPFYRDERDVEGMTVSVVKNVPVYHHLVTQHPKILLQTYDKPSEALKAVSEGKADLFIGALPVVGYTIQKNQIANLKIAGSSDLEDFLFSFAVRSDYPELTGILNKAIRSVSQQEHDDIFHKWMPVRYEHVVEWKTIWQWVIGIGGALGSLLGILLLWNRQLSKEIAERRLAEDALRQSEKELRIRNQINHILLSFPDEEMYSEILKIITEIMQSEYGTFGYFDDNGDFISPAMTRQIYWEQCNVPEKNILFEKGKFGGIFADAVRKQKTLIANKGPFRMPDGHVPIRNTMVTPVIFRDSVISAIHIANKNGIYDENDQKLLEMIADNIAPVLYARLTKGEQEYKRRVADKKIEENERILSALLNAVDDSVWLFSPNHIILVANTTAARRFGNSVSDIIGKDWRDIAPPHLVQSRKQKLEEVLSTGEPIEFEDERAGIVFYHSFYPVKDAMGNVMAIASFSRDITKRKHSENVLKLNEARLESLLRISQYKTDTAEELLAYTLSEAIRLTVSKIG